MGRQAARGTGQRRPATHAFSLAELMIALVILGLGLLFIAAALPVGLEYTRQTVDLATGEAAAGYALQQLELNLRTSADLYDRAVSAAVPIGSGRGIRLDNLHRPRTPDTGPLLAPDPRHPHPLNASYEPFFKVRPLVMGNIRVGAVPSGSTRGIVDDGELVIAAYFAAMGAIFTTPTWEIDLVLDSELSLLVNPALPGLARVYSPTEPVTTFTVPGFFNNANAYPTYGNRFDLPGQPGSLTAQQQQDEWEKALDRRVAWTAFYRRISYKAEKGPDGNWYTSDDVAEDPLTYEIIIVVTRRTSVNHRFPRQQLTASPNLAVFETPQALVPTNPPSDDALIGTDRLAPTPWLVTFDSSQADNWVSPQLELGTDYAALFPDPVAHPFYMERILNSSFSHPLTLTFRCTAEVGRLLPRGSIFIPAVNDQRYMPQPGLRPVAGFVPSAPESLPIYEVAEVVEGPADQPWEIKVKSNGYYPWLTDPTQPQAWPVWVIPPAFVERDADGQPIYERSSPILNVVRRTVTLHEMRP
jgi:prepilin-type N-terminal cleavage/methylation domain-containing protein